MASSVHNSPCPWYLTNTSLKCISDPMYWLHPPVRNSCGRTCNSIVLDSSPLNLLRVPSVIHKGVYLYLDVFPRLILQRLPYHKPRQTVQFVHMASPWGSLTAATSAPRTYGYRQCLHRAWLSSCWLWLYVYSFGKEGQATVQAKRTKYLQVSGEEQRHLFATSSSMDSEAPRSRLSWSCGKSLHRYGRALAMDCFGGVALGDPHLVNYQLPPKYRFFSSQLLSVIPPAHLRGFAISNIEQ